MSEHGQGRSYLRAGVVVPFQERDGYTPVVAGAIDLAACCARAAYVLRNTASAAEIDDEVQEEIIRVWMSGRGLPASPALALRAIVRRVVQRVWSDGAGGRRGRLARWRRQLRSHDAHPFVVDSGRSESHAVLEQVPAVHGSIARVEAQIDATVASQVVVWRNRPSARRSAALAVLAGLTDKSDMASDEGMSPASVDRYCRTLTATLREHLSAIAAAPEIAHGTTYAYTHHKCRCAECRQVWAEYNRSVYLRRKAKHDPKKRM